MWSNEAISDEKIAVWQALLADLPWPAVEAAAFRHMQTATFFPKPAELRGLVATAAIGDRPSAAEAWETVLSEVRNVGLRGPYRFDDAVISEAVRRIGWNRICTDDLSKGYLQRDFTAAYQAASERRIDAVQTGAMPLPAGVTALNGAANHDAH